MLEHARQLRREMTPPERLVWGRLRDRRIGAKFRRQVPIGPYVVDFYCAQARLVMEIDGAQAHDLTCAGMRTCAGRRGWRRRDIAWSGSRRPRC